MLQLFPRYRIPFLDFRTQRRPLFFLESLNALSELPISYFRSRQLDDLRRVGTGLGGRGGDGRSVFERDHS